MITSSWPRLVIGTIFLFTGAGTGLMAWAVETCANDKADSLLTGMIALIANLAAWVLLGRRVPSKLVLFVAILPALAALMYTNSTVQLAVGYLTEGRGACELLMADADAARDGREVWFIVLWAGVCASFWGGVVPVAWRAVKVWKGSGK